MYGNIIIQIEMWNTIQSGIIGNFTNSLNNLK